MPTLDFSKIWGVNSSLTAYQFTDSDYLKGWEFVGSIPPARTQFDTFFRLTDTKLKYLYDNAFTAEQADAKITTHNTSNAAHSDIRQMITSLNVGAYMPRAGGTFTGTVTIADEQERTIQGLASRMGIGFSNSYLQAYDWAQSQSVWKYTNADKTLVIGANYFSVAPSMSVGGDLSVKGNLDIGHGKHITLRGLVDGTMVPYLDFAVGDGSTSGSISFAADQNFHLHHAGVSGTNVGLVTGDLVANGHLWMEDTTVERNIRSRSGNMGFIFPTGGAYLGAFDWGNNVIIWAYTKASKMLEIGASLLVSGEATFSNNVIIGDGGENRVVGYNSQIGFLFNSGSLSGFDYKKNVRFMLYNGSTAEFGGTDKGVSTKLLYPAEATVAVKNLTTGAPQLYFENTTGILGFLQVQADRLTLGNATGAVRLDLYARDAYLDGGIAMAGSVYTAGLTNTGSANFGGEATFNANLVMGDGGGNKLRGYSSNYGLIFRAGSFGAYDWKSNNKIWNYDGSTVEIGADRQGVQTKIVYSNQANATIKALTADAPRLYFENLSDVMGFVQVQSDRFVLCKKDGSVADLYANSGSFAGTLTVAGKIIVPAGITGEASNATLLQGRDITWINAQVTSGDQSEANGNGWRRVGRTLIQWGKGTQNRAVAFRTSFKTGTIPTVVSVPCVNTGGTQNNSFVSDISISGFMPGGEGSPQINYVAIGVAPDDLT